MIPAGRLGERVPDVRKIAVLRANAIGDLMFSLPALEALRAAYPAAEIVLLAREWHAAFLHGRPGPVDRVEVLPPIRGISLPGPPEVETDTPQPWLARMRAERFDIALQLHGGGLASNPFIASFGARVTAGMRAPDAAPLDRWIRYVYFAPEVARYLEVVALLGAPPVTLEARVSVTDADRADARAAFDAAGPYVVLHPGATDPRRRWPADRFARLGDRLAANGYRVCITGDATEARLVDAVADAMRAPCARLCAAMTLGGLAALLADASLVVGNDTGPLHLARAVGAPSVTIFWAGNLINGGPFFRGRERALGSWQIACPECGAENTGRRCAHDPSFVAAVSYDEVEAEAFDLLAGEPAAVPVRA